MTVLENVPLAPLTTLKVGGPARYFTEPKSAAEVAEAVNFARSQDLPLFVLGGGSNLVISDAGWPGLVLKLAISGIDERDGKWQSAVRSGRGRRVGPIRGPRRRQKLRRSRMPERHSGQRGRNPGAECRSLRPGSLRNHRVRAGVRSQRRAGPRTLRRSLRISISHQHLQHQRARTFHHPARDLWPDAGRQASHRVCRPEKTFCRISERPSLASTREAVRRIRATKAMLITPGDEDCRSAGSFFKNPVLTADQYDESDAARQRPRDCRSPVIPRSMPREKFPPPGWWSTPVSARAISSGRVGHLAQACPGHRESRRRHRRRHPGLERPYSAARGRTLGHSSRSRSRCSWASEFGALSTIFGSLRNGCSKLRYRSRPFSPALGPIPRGTPIPGTICKPFLKL